MSMPGRRTTISASRSSTSSTESYANTGRTSSCACAPAPCSCWRSKARTPRRIRPSVRPRELRGLPGGGRQGRLPRISA
jgi:hypothetical protein